MATHASSAGPSNNAECLPSLLRPESFVEKSSAWVSLATSATCERKRSPWSFTEGTTHSCRSATAARIGHSALSSVVRDATVHSRPIRRYACAGWCTKEHSGEPHADSWQTTIALWVRARSEPATGDLAKAETNL